jgi:hypothetical protein
VAVVVVLIVVVVVAIAIVMAVVVVVVVVVAIVALMAVVAVVSTIVVTMGYQVVLRSLILARGTNNTPLHYLSHQLSYQSNLNLIQSYKGLLKIVEGTLTLTLILRKRVRKRIKELLFLTPMNLLIDF